MSGTKKRNKISKVLAILSIVDIVVILCGFLFRIMHWQGSNLMLVLGLSFVCYLLWGFMIYRFIVDNKKPMPTADRVFMNISYGLFFIFGAFLIVGILFLVMHWPGGRLNLIVGLVGTIIAAIICIILRIREEKNNNTQSDP
jgi:membrane protease YdiL (CAAX protease family)